MFKDAPVSMETIFGDGSEPQETGFLGKLLGSAKRVLSGTTLLMTRFANTSGAPARVAFSAPYPGKILALRLDKYGGELICQRETFLAAPQGVKIDIAFQKQDPHAAFSAARASSCSGSWVATGSSCTQAAW